MSADDGELVKHFVKRTTTHPPVPSRTRDGCGVLNVFADLHQHGCRRMTAHEATAGLSAHNPKVTVQTSATDGRSVNPSAAQDEYGSHLDAGP
jgi:hypothetical protein